MSTPARHAPLVRRDKPRATARLTVPRASMVTDATSICGPTNREMGKLRMPNPIPKKASIPNAVGARSVAGDQNLCRMLFAGLRACFEIARMSEKSYGSAFLDSEVKEDGAA